jgi:hypothetical protein
MIQRPEEVPSVTTWQRVPERTEFPPGFAPVRATPGQAHPARCEARRERRKRGRWLAWGASPRRRNGSKEIQPRSGDRQMRNRFCLSPPPGAFLLSSSLFLGLTPQAKHVSPLRGSRSCARRALSSRASGLSRRGPKRSRTPATQAQESNVLVVRPSRPHTAGERDPCGRDARTTTLTFQVKPESVPRASNRDTR